MKWVAAAKLSQIVLRRIPESTKGLNLWDFE